MGCLLVASAIETEDNEHRHASPVNINAHLDDIEIEPMIQKNINQHIDEQQNNIEMLKTSLMELNNKYEILESQHNDINSKYTEKCNAFNQLNVQYNEQSILLMDAMNNKQKNQNEITDITEKYSELQKELNHIKTENVTRTEKLEIIYQNDYEKLLNELNECKQQTQLEISEYKLQSVQYEQTIEQLQNAAQDLKHKNKIVKQNQVKLQEIYEGEYEKLLNEFQEYKLQYPGTHS
eukprot:545525_1